MAINPDGLAGLGRFSEPAFTRLEERGLIEPLATEERRRPYRLTRTGHRVLSERLQRIRSVVRVGDARLANG